MHITEWAIHDNLWVRRASLLAYLHHGDKTNVKLMSDTILKLAHEKEFFIRKAIGWILRDYSYSNPMRVQEFTSQHKCILSELSKREALKAINRAKPLLIHQNRDLAEVICN